MIKPAFLTILLALSANALTACGGVKLRPDPSPPAIDSNYPTAEIYAGDKHFVGLGIIEVPYGSDVADLDISVQGYYQGRAKFVSASLGLDKLFTYKGNMKVRAQAESKVTMPALIGMTVAPTWPGQTGQVIDVHPLQGWLLVNPVQVGEKWSYLSSKTPEEIDAWIQLPTQGISTIDVISPECGVAKELAVTGPTRRIALSELGLKPENKRCVLQMVMSGSAGTRYALWAAWRYAKDFQPLSEPTADFYEQKVDLAAESAVTVVSVDETFRVSNFGTFPFDQEDPHVVRLLTVKGRVLVGQWMPEKKEFAWKR